MGIPTTVSTITDVIDRYGVTQGIIVILLIFVAVAYVAMYKYIIRSETKFNSYVKAKDVESIATNKAHSTEMSEIHKAHSTEMTRLNKAHTDKITEILVKHDEHIEKMQTRHIEENKETTAQFITALRETTEALHTIKDFNKLRFNAMEKDLGEIKQKINSQN